MAVSNDYLRQADALREQAADAARRARSNKDLRPEVVYAEVARINYDLRKQMADLKVQSDAAHARYVAAKGLKAWGATPGTEMSYRSALQSLDGVSDMRVLQQRMTQAVNTGDKVLQRAVSYHAYNNVGGPGARAVIDAYTEANPDAATALADLELAKSSNAGQIGGDARMLFAFAAPQV